MTAHGNLPFPELLGGDRGKNWEVKEGEHGETSMLDPLRKKMTAPADDIPCHDCGHIHAPPIRAHELMHARYSPVGTYRRSFTHRKVKRFVEDKYIHMAEETRIDYIAKSLWESGAIRMWDEGEYYPSCGKAILDAFGHHLRRQEFRSAAEMMYIARWGQPSDEPLSTIWDQMSLHLQQYLKTIVPKASKSHLIDLADYAMDYDLKAFMTLLEEWFPGTVAKMTKPQRKHLARTVVGTRMLWNYSSYICHSELVMEHKVEELKDISWNKVLRYGYVLQERFKEFSESVDNSTIEFIDALDDFAKGEEPAPGMKLRPALSKSDPDPERVVTTRTGSEPTYERPTVSKADHEDLFGRLESPVVSGDHKYGYPVGECEWQGMKVTKAVFDKRYPEWKLQRAKARARDEGAVPRFMHRFATDKRVFAHKYKTPTISVLVDDSGSMGLTPEDVTEIIEAAPGSIVGVYAGSDGGTDTLGRLNVVAFDGQRCTTNVGIDEFGGNGCDYPALEWLAEQPWPRIWYSDGGVTTPYRSRGPGETITSQVSQLMSAAGIIRVRSLDQLKAIFDGSVKLPRPRHRYYKRNMKNKPDMLLTDRWRGRSQKGYKDK